MTKKRINIDSQFNEDELLSTVGMYGATMAQGNYSDIVPTSDIDKGETRKRPKINIDYETRFLRVGDKSKRKNASVTIHQEHHTNMTKLLGVMGEDRVTINTYLNNILTVHFEQYAQEVNELYKTKGSNNLIVIK